MALTHLYNPLPKNEQDCANHTPQGPTKRKIAAIIFAVLLTVLSVTLIAILSLRSKHTADAQNCGSSPGEALALGCHFDIMSFCWLPTQCYDEALTDDFMQAGPWKWYTDRGGGVEVPEDVVHTGAYENLFVSFDYHRHHCAYMWSKLHRAVISGGPIDSYIGDYNHTRHCQRVLLPNNISGDNVETMIRTKYPTCG